MYRPLLIYSQYNTWEGAPATLWSQPQVGLLYQDVYWLKHTCPKYNHHRNHS